MFDKKIPAVCIKDVSLFYGKENAVRGVCLDIKQNESFGLIGLNGAGKTTLIKSIVGLKSVDEGSIHILGERADIDKNRRHFFFLPERFEPAWFLNGMEFLKFSAKIYNDEFCENKAIEIVASLGLDVKVLSRRVQTYSKGMRQKLGLAAAFLSRCEVLILDEPMSGLDPKARSLVKALVKRDRSENKRTLFFSSHILADMQELCDRVAIIHEGEMKFTGSLKVLQKQTQTPDLEKSFLHVINAV